MDQLTLDQNLSVCKFWDLGPKRPETPKQPVGPVPPAEGLKGVAKAEAETRYELAKVEFEDALIDYKAGLRSYGADLKAFEAWRKANGGPILIERNPVVAREAIQRDPDRYMQTLPKGMKPGFGHAANQQQQADRAKALAADAAKDPHFGGTHAQTAA